MGETINAENKKQGRQKPPLNVGRITGEILAGMASGLAVALPVAYLTVNADRFQSCFGPLGAIVVLFYVFPIIYGLGSAVGVYLVGNRSKQRGLFMATSVSGFLAGLLTIFIISILFRLQFIMTTTQSSSVLIIGLMVEAQRIIKWAQWAFVLLLPPTGTTLSFNMFLRYKVPPSS